MAENETFDNETALNDNNSQQDHDSQAEMLKPWMKTLGKEFYRNEDLAGFDSLTDAVRSLLGRPKAKEIPESYGVRDGFEETFKKAGLTLEEAREIDGKYSELLPKAKPDLKNVFKDRYDETMKLYADGVKGISDDLSSKIKANGLDKDPVFVEIMARVGKETGEETFVEPKDSPKGRRNYAMELLQKAYRKG